MAIYQGDEKIVDRYVGETLVTRAYQGDKLIFDAYSELSGTLPLTVRSRASQVLENYIIYGESVQDGTPAPDNPVEVTGLGVRTVNLLPKTQDLLNGYINVVGVLSPQMGGCKERVSDYIPINPEEQYTLSAIPQFPYTGTEYLTQPWRAIAWYDVNKNFISRPSEYYASPLTQTAPSNAYYARVSFRTYSIDVKAMFTKTATAPVEYIPYGYKLPITVTAGGTSTDYPIYIGDSQLMRIPNTEHADYVDYEKGKIVRQVKKLVLTGNENWIALGSNKVYTGVTNYINSAWGTSSTLSRCSHYLPTTSADGNGEYNLGGLTNATSTRWNGNVIINPGLSLSDFKQFLSDQYAAGTPVTFWYVLETPVEEDPPVPFPDITLPQGTVTIDIDGNLKPQATVKGRINPTV